MELFSKTQAKVRDAATTVQNIAMVAVLALCTAFVALVAALTHRGA